MKTKFTLAILALTLAPAVAFAGGCAGGHSAQSASCQLGSTWDADKGSCVADVNA